MVKLWIGEGDLPTPPFIVEAAHRAMQAGHTRYATSLGLPRLREALGAYHARHWGVPIPPDRFAVTAGGMNAIMQAVQALLERATRSSFPPPPGRISPRRCGWRAACRSTCPNRVDGHGRFSLPLEDIAAALTPRTRVVMM